MESLGTKFLEAVNRIYRARFLYFAISGEEDVRGILQDIYGELDFGPLGEEGIHVMLRWTASMERPCERSIALRC